MNVFGVEISLANGNGNGKLNGKYVRKEECHKAHEDLTRYLDGKFEDTHKRIDDFINSVNNYVDLLKKQ